MSGFSLAGIAKLMMTFGALLLIGGAVLLLLDKLKIPLGRLPGDIYIAARDGRGSFYFPVTTSIVLSIALTLLLNLIGKFFK